MDDMLAESDIDLKGSSVVTRTGSAITLLTHVQAPRLAAFADNLGLAFTRVDAPRHESGHRPATGLDPSQADDQAALEGNGEGGAETDAATAADGASEAQDTA